MSEDAHEYIIALKLNLLEELQPEQVNSNLTASNHPYNRELHMSMQTFWNLFCSGKTTQTVTCSECSNVTSRDDDFSEIMLKFPTPVENTGIRTRNITLANLYENHKTGVIDDYMCIPCNSRRSATRQERISQCPKILTIVLSRNVDNEEGSIDSAVEFPLERVCPSTLGVQQDEIADSTAYKLFGIVQHTSNANGGGHYTAITHNNTANVWQLYDDHDVTICKFRNRGTNKALVRFQKAASILFYKREGPERLIMNESIMGDTTRPLNINNGKPSTNPNTQHVIKYSPQIRNAHANTIIFGSPHSRL
jgi:ubiquitin C-terminal hydrolase